MKNKMTLSWLAKHTLSCAIAGQVTFYSVIELNWDHELVENYFEEKGTSVLITVRYITCYQS